MGILTAVNTDTFAMLMFMLLRTIYIAKANYCIKLHCYQCFVDQVKLTTVCN